MVWKYISDVKIKKSQTIYVHALTISFLLWMYNDVLDTHMWARKLSNFFCFMYCSSIFRSYCLLLFFFVCLLVCGFSYHLRSFHSYENVTIADVGLKIFTYSPHSWPLNSDGSLAYHTYCDTGHPFICHLRGHVTLTITAERLAVKLSFYDLDLSRLRLEHPTFR